MSFIRSEDVSVGGLLNGHHVFEIPAFQRDYSWTQTEAQRLYDDLIAAFETAQQSEAPLPFFLGTMLFVSPDEPISSIRSALVVDGQQRLITLTILIAALRDYVGKEHQAQLHRHIALLTHAEPFEFDVFHVLPRETDARFLEHAVQRRGATRLPRGKADLAPANEPQRRMETVRALFVKRLKDQEPERRLLFAQFLLDSCRVLRVWAPDIDFAYRLFLSINKPGLPLSDEDIVLAEVVGPLAVDQRRRYETIIAQMSRYREPQKKGRRQDKTFFTHLAIAQRWTRSDRMITLLRRVVAREGGPQRFASTIFEPMAEAYLVTRGDWPRAAYSEAVWERLDRLRVLECFCCSEWVPVAMLLLARVKGDEECLLAHLEGLDRLAFVLALTRATADERRASYAPIIDQIWQSDVVPPPEVLWTLDEQREAATVRRAALKLQDSANGADKAVLIRLDAQVSGRQLDRYLTLIDTKFVGDEKLTLEHVLPDGDTLSKSSGWRPEFSQIRYRKMMANTIGNLVLLEQNRNKAAGQADFEKKKRSFFPNGSAHDLLLTDRIRFTEEWTRETVERRFREMMAAFLDTWDFRAPIPELPPIPGTSADVAGPAKSSGRSNAGRHIRHVRKRILGGKPRKSRNARSASGLTKPGEEA
jgi:Protein of unknown function DUF262/Protein of unknown function (DUF1524)